MKISYKLFIFFLCLFISINPLTAYSKDSSKNSDFSLQILHFNDIHSAESINMSFSYNNTSFQNKAGGFPRLIEAVKNTKKEKNSITIFAGDLFQQGYPLFSYTKGSLDYKLLCMTSPLIMTLGNHEIYETDTGILENLITNIEKNKSKCNIDIVLANAEFKNNKIQNSIKPYIIKEFSGEKVAFIGVTVYDSAFKNIQGVKVTNPYTAISNIVKKLKKDEINKIVVISHTGIEEDKLVAEKISDIDIITGGHSHTIQGDFSKLNITSSENNYPLINKKNNTYIVTAGHHGLILGNITLYFDKSGRIKNSKNQYKMLIDYTDNKSLNKKLKRIENAELIYENKKAVKKTAGTYKNISNMMNKTAGYAFDNLTALKAGMSFSIDNHFSSSLGTMASKAIYFTALYENKNPDLAVINNGAVRTGINRGKITNGILEQALPFENNLYAVKLKGSVILDYIRNSSYNLIKNKKVNPYPSIYGAKFKYSISKNKITEQYILKNNKWQKFHNNKNYTVIMSSFVLDSYEPFKKNALKIEKISITDKLSYKNFIKNNSPVKAENDYIIIEN